MKKIVVAFWVKGSYLLGSKRRRLFGKRRQGFEKRCRGFRKRWEDFPKKSDGFGKRWEDFGKRWEDFWVKDKTAVKDKKGGSFTTLEYVIQWLDYQW